MAESKRKEVDEALKGVDFSKKSYRVDLETSMGPIRLKLMPELAPNHCRNLIGLSKIGFYDGLVFHRVVPGFVIQGGCPTGTGTGGPGYKVDAEFNKTPHKIGVLSMARSSDPNSAGSQFFVCLKDVPFLDNQYTAFGIADDAESLAVVEKIGKTATDDGDRPLEDVVIQKAVVVEVDSGK